MKTRCSAQPELMIGNVSVFNTAFREFYPADVYILDGKFYYIDIKKERRIAASEYVEGNGRYMIPGLIDIHMHIESSMMTPAVMSERLSACGVTTIVAEPHEMANVNGVQGIMDMIANGINAPIDIYYGAPSCVPSTDPSLETTGGILNADSMKALLGHPDVICLGEVMNYRQIIRDNDLEISHLLDDLARDDPRCIIEGHCPSLTDEDLAKFIYLGIDSDHTEHDIEELRQRFFMGMFVEIQEKTLTPEIVSFIEQKNLYGHFGFVTDDVMADTLMDRGHLDHIVRLAIKCGMSPEQAVYHSTYTNAQRMKLTDRGQIAPGKLADFTLLTDLTDMHIDATYKNGIQIFGRSADNPQSHSCGAAAFSRSYLHTVNLDPVQYNDLALHTDDIKSGKVLAEVIKVSSGTTRTDRSHICFPVKKGIVQWENSGCLLVAVFERYKKSGRIGYGFVTGDCIKNGAAATTYAHDHHNLVVVGSNIPDMLLAANTVIESQGGICVTKDSNIFAFLPLPVGGILSEESADVVGKKLRDVRQALINQGYKHNNPIMSLCTLSLLASPCLKISDRGIIDVASGDIVPLFDYGS